MKDANPGGKNRRKFVRKSAENWSKKFVIKNMRIIFLKLLLMKSQ